MFCINLAHQPHKGDAKRKNGCLLPSFTHFHDDVKRPPQILIGKSCGAPCAPLFPQLFLNDCSPSFHLFCAYTILMMILLHFGWVCSLFFQATGCVGSLFVVWFPFFHQNAHGLQRPCRITVWFSPVCWSCFLLALLHVFFVDPNGSECLSPKYICYPYILSYFFHLLDFADTQCLKKKFCSACGTTLDSRRPHLVASLFLPVLCVFLYPLICSSACVYGRWHFRLCSACISAVPPVFRREMEDGIGSLLPHTKVVAFAPSPPLSCPPQGDMHVLPTPRRSPTTPTPLIFRVSPVSESFCCLCLSRISIGARPQFVNNHPHPHRLCHHHQQQQHQRHLQQQQMPVRTVHVKIERFFSTLSPPRQRFGAF